MRLPASPIYLTNPEIITSSRSKQISPLKMEGDNGTFNTGMTSAISTAGPKPLDLKLTKDLEESLKPHGGFESVEEMTHRMEILSKLDHLVKQWVKDISVQKNIPPSVAEHVIILMLSDNIFLEKYIIIIILHLCLTAWWQNLHIRFVQIRCA